MVMAALPTDGQPLRSLLCCLYLLLTLFAVSSTTTEDGVMVCEQYDPHECDPQTDLNCNTTKVCSSPEPGKRVHCFAMWTNDSGHFTLTKKGCWIDYNKCYDKQKCDALYESQGFYFCCCDSVMCNQNLYWKDFPTTPAPDIVAIGQVPDKRDSQLVETLLYSFVPIIGVAFVVALSFRMWTRHRFAYREQLPTMEPSPQTPPSPLVGLRPLQLKEVKARGRFGCVWKAQLLTEVVAVKIFPLQEEKSWKTEVDVYQMSQFNGHENVLHFIASEKRGENIGVELWLITEFHELGSLYDFLKGHVINWHELLKITESMARGLAFLHEDLPATSSAGPKPAVSHRDFKSKNVLIKKDLSACIADFGLALQFEPGKSPGDTHGQVGTRRYMAPEVLEGAISFNRDAFLRIDMYACGLVIWEVISRCTAADGPVDEYQLPFEEEVGLHPSLEDIQDAVIHKKLRPRVKDTWLKHAGLQALCLTIEECWDGDAEARLSSGCVEQRIAQLSRNASGPTSNSNTQQTTCVVTMPIVNQEMPPRESKI